MGSTLLYWPEAGDDPALKSILQRDEAEYLDEAAEWDPLNPGAPETAGLEDPDDVESPGTEGEGEEADADAEADAEAEESVA
jgi:hypothetical protein